MSAAHPAEDVGKLIRSNHPFALRSGQWGQIIGLKDVQARDPNDRRWRKCYVVHWDDRESPAPVSDFWPVEDEVAGYEFAVIES